MTQRTTSNRRRAAARERIGHLLDYCIAHDYLTTPPKLEYLTIRDVEDCIPIQKWTAYDYNSSR